MSLAPSWDAIPRTASNASRRADPRPREQVARITTSALVEGDTYDTRAPEYDEWYLGLGRFDGLERPHWDDELHELERVIASLPEARTLDVACGTGFLTRHLRGEVTGLDQSEQMLAIARERMRRCPLPRRRTRSPLRLRPVPAPLTCYFYGHLEEPERERFLTETRRVAPQLIVVDSAQRPDRQPVEREQQRTLNSGEQFYVYKRYFERRPARPGAGRRLGSLRGPVVRRGRIAVSHFSSAQLPGSLF